MTDAHASWVDGELVAPGVPAIPADDQGFLLGLAVFETLLQEDGHRYFEAEHLARLQCGAGVLGIPWPPPHDPAGALEAYGATLGDGAFAVRLSLSRGSPGGAPRMVIGSRRVDPSPAAGVAVAVARHAKPLDLALEGTKSSSRLRNVLAREEAQAEGAWDALICTSDGDFAEGTVSNLFVVLQGTVVTPPLERGALAGIVRAELIAGLREEGIPVLERRVTPGDLEACDELFLTNSLVRVVPVHAVRGVRDDLPGAGGPVTIRAREAIARRERDEARRVDRMA